MKIMQPKLRFKEFTKNWGNYLIQDLLNDGLIISHLDGNHGALYPKSSEFSSQGIPYITANDFTDGKVNFAGCKFLPKEKAVKFKKGIARNGDVLFAHNATVGPVAILETKLDYVVLSTTATYFRLLPQKISNKFFLYSLQSEFFVRQYKKVMSQSTRDQVPITTQRKFTVQLPEFDEQTKIASFLSAIDEKITKLTKKHELLIAYKNGVMQKIFNQEIRFKDDAGNDYQDWGEKTLAEVSKKKSSPISANKIENNFGKYKIYGASGVLKTVDFFAEENPYVSVVKDGAGVGRAFLCDGETSVLGTMEMVIPKECIDVKYLYEVINRINFREYVTGSTIPHVYYKDYSLEIVPLPSIEEQRKIASFLSALDEKILIVQKQLELTKQYKQGLLQQMFI